VLKELENYKDQSAAWHILIFYQKTTGEIYLMIIVNYVLVFTVIVIYEAL